MSHQSAHKASSNFKIADADSPVKYESDVSIKRIAHEIADVDPKPKQEFMSYEELKKMSFEKLLNMQSSVAKKVENVGILLVVSPHEDSDVYYRKIYNQARMIRELEPDINICLLAPNMDKHQSAILGSVINRFKQIPNSGSFSLMHAMKLSPYAITLFIRSDIVLCMPFISDILPFFEEKQLDIVYSGNSHDTCPLTVEDSDFGAVMYRPFNEKFLKISDLWIKNVPKVGDQSAYLKRFLYNHRYELKIGRFSPSFGGSLRPVPEIEMVGGKNYTHYQSRIISGQVKFFKMQSDSPKFSSELCDFLNSYTLPRSLIWNKKKNPSLVHGALKDSLEFFVTEEDCELAVEGKCDNIPWDLPEAIEVVDLPKRARGTKIGVVYSILETDLEKYQSKMKEIVNSVSSVRNVESEVSITFISHDFFPDCLSKESHNFDNIILVS
jgi:hypothetical protein